MVFQNIKNLRNNRINNNNFWTIKILVSDSVEALMTSDVEELKYLYRIGVKQYTIDEICI